MIKFLIYERYHPLEHYRQGRKFNFDPLHLQISIFSWKCQSKGPWEMVRSLCNSLEKWLVGCDDFNFFFQIFLALILGSWMIVRWLMVLFKVHRDALYTPHVPINRRDPQNEAKIQHKSINFKAFFNQVLETINTFFLNDC